MNTELPSGALASGAAAEGGGGGGTFVFLITTSPLGFSSAAVVVGGVEHEESNWFAHVYPSWRKEGAAAAHLSYTHSALLWRR